MLSQRQQQGAELGQIRLRKNRPLLLLNGDIESFGGAGDLGGQIILRDRLIDLGLGMRRAQRGYDHRIEIEGHQCQAEAEQRGLRVAQGVELGVQMPLQFLKRRLNGPPAAIQLGHSGGIGLLGGQVGQQDEIPMPIAGWLLELEHDAPPGPGVPLGIGDLHRLLGHVAIVNAPERLQGTERFDSETAVMADDKGSLTPGDGGQEGGDTEVAIGDPQVVGLNRLGDLAEQTALLGMAIGAGEHVTEQAPRVIEDHQRFAWQGRRRTVTQGLESPFAGGQTVAIEVTNAIARKAFGPLAAEFIDDLGGIVGDPSAPALGRSTTRPV